MLAKINKNGFKKISDELMFEYLNLRFLSNFKEFKNLFSSNFPRICRRINYIYEFAFRNWRSGLRTKSKKLCFEMEYVFLKARSVMF